MENKLKPGSKSSKFISGSDPDLEKLAKNRSVVPVAFILIVLFFFFSFCNFRMNGTQVASLKGINLITGMHLKTQVGEFPANFWAILAFASAITGFIVFFRKEKQEALFGILLAAFGFISLFIMRLVIKDKVESQGSGMIHIEASFLFGYWASVLAFFVAGGISYLRYRNEKKAKTKPPPNKPPSPTPIHVNIITQHTEPD